MAEKKAKASVRMSVLSPEERRAVQALLEAKRLADALGEASSPRASSGRRAAFISSLAIRCAKTFRLVAGFSLILRR